MVPTKMLWLPSLVTTMWLAPMLRPAGTVGLLNELPAGSALTWKLAPRSHFEHAHPHIV